MKRIVISKLFLYRYRFVIGYSLLSVAFVLLLLFLPAFSQRGLSGEEINSATESYYLNFGKVSDGDIVDLPYHLLQKASISLLGLSSYSVKLPSIIVGLLLGLFLVLLLNRWFKSNVSLLASCLMILSSPFLFLAGSGTPLIMLLFWPTVLLWLGSKIQGEKRPKPFYCFVFAIAMLLSLFTPYMMYFAVFCVVFVLLQPHLRFIAKNLPRLPLIAVIALCLIGVAILVMASIRHPDTLARLLLVDNFSLEHLWRNLSVGFAPVFTWNGSIEGVFLSPLISLPILALSLIGLFSTTKGFFASRNSIATLLLIFAVLLTCFEPDAVIAILLPFSILVAHGIKYLLEKWYGLFPENPYARISAVIPLSALFLLMIVPSLLHYSYGYRFDPNVARQFSERLSVIREHINSGYLVADEHYEFYKILENSYDIKVVNDANSTNGAFAHLGRPEKVPEQSRLDRIITSPMLDNSDIIYVYKITQPTEGE